MSGSKGRGAAALPLSALLSQALVAFTIEFDNEYERRTPHSVTRQGSIAGLRQGPWLTSMAMWSTCMRFVGEEGVAVGELERLARTKTNLNGMERWGYVTVAPDPADSRPKPPRSSWLIRATAKGRMAREVWRPLFGEIETRWQGRFGADEIAGLREALWAAVSQFDLELPDCLPILGYGLFSRGPEGGQRAPAGEQDKSGPRLSLAALLSRALLAFAVEFERAPSLSLAISANVVRVLDEKGVRVRDLPLLSGVSKEAIAMAMGFLQKMEMAVVEAGNRVKVARLTEKGLAAQDAYWRRTRAIEERWRERFGDAAMGDLRERLERLAGEPGSESPPLFRGLEPYPEGWRARVPKPKTLPHYPMVLHRGGFPDGS